MWLTGYNFLAARHVIRYGVNYLAYMDKALHYRVQVEWTGNNGTGTSGYEAYGRNHIIRIAGKPDILASTDAHFRGDTTRHNPEDMLLSALSTCHMLWYLHLCADAGVIVTGYTDDAEGTLTLAHGVPGRFTDAILRPRVTVASADMTEKAIALHVEASKKCFIANSVNFIVRHQPSVVVAG